MNKLINAVLTFIKKCGLLAFIVAFLTIAVMNQQTFIKDLSSRVPTSEVVIEANTLNLIKKWNTTLNFSFNSIVSVDELESDDFDGKIYFPTQNKDTSSNPCVFELFNIPPPVIA